MSQLTLNEQQEQGEDFDSDIKVRQSNVNDLYHLRTIRPQSI